MKDEKAHIKEMDQKSTDFFAGGEINWNKSEEEVWNALSEQINKKTTPKVNVKFTYEKYAVAALVLFLIAFGFTSMFFTETITCEPGQNLLVEFPDGSTANLNAVSTLKYYPLKWKLQRKVFFEGEGFFEVVKGDPFVVISANGSTKVLGTSFNVFARDDKYKVTCITGKVKVMAGSAIPVTLTPNKQATLKQGNFVVNEQMKTEEVTAWKNKQFYFPNTPLKEVFKELERQYAITIKVQPELSERNFSSNFPKKPKVEEILDYICTSMQIKFVKQSETVFLIVENS